MLNSAVYMYLTSGTVNKIYASVKIVFFFSPSKFGTLIESYFSNFSPGH